MGRTGDGHRPGAGGAVRGGGGEEMKDRPSKGAETIGKGVQRRTSQTGETGHVQIQKTRLRSENKGLRGGKKKGKTGCREAKETVSC